MRMEVRSPHCGPLRALGLQRVAWLPAAWPLCCAHLFGLEGQRPSPESHVGRAVMLPSFAAPKLHLRPRTEHPPWWGAGRVGAEGS